MYNVYPLYDGMIRRLAKVKDVLFGDQKEFVYYTPGTFCIAEKAVALVQGRSHRIEITIDLKGIAESVFGVCGGMTGGYYGTQVSKRYRGTNRFNEELDKFTITLTD